MKNESYKPAKSLAALVSLALGAAACGSAPEVPPTDGHRRSAQELCADPSATSANVRPITSFGAVGDGVTDDYAALVAAADWIATQPATPQPAIVFPPGTYKIDRVYSTTKPPSEVCTRGSLCLADHIVWRNLPGARIQGCGDVRIKLKADFRQTAGSWIMDDRYRPTLTTIDPFVIKGGVGFVIDGFEIDGSANDTVRDPEVYPDLSGGVGIQTQGSENYLLSNLVVHHMQSDGIVIGNLLCADEAFMLDHVTSRQNGRQPLTILSARRGVFSNVELEGTEGFRLPAICR